MTLRTAFKDALSFIAKGAKQLMSNPDIMSGTPIIYNDGHVSIARLQARETEEGSGQYMLYQVSTLRYNVSSPLPLDFMQGSTTSPLDNLVHVEPIYPGISFSREEARRFVNDPRNMPGYQSPATFEAV